MNYLAKLDAKILKLATLIDHPSTPDHEAGAALDMWWALAAKRARLVRDAKEQSK